MEALYNAFADIKITLLWAPVTAIFVIGAVSLLIRLRDDSGETENGRDNNRKGQLLNFVMTLCVICGTSVTYGILEAFLAAMDIRAEDNTTVLVEGLGFFLLIAGLQIVSLLGKLFLASKGLENAKLITNNDEYAKNQNMTICLMALAELPCLIALVIYMLRIFL